jgi:hypothetical protein
MSKKDKLLQWAAGADCWLKKAIGEGNEILYHFVRLLLIAVVAALLVGAAVWLVSAVFNVVAIVFAAFVAAAPYLLAVAIVAGVATFAVHIYRQRRQRRRASETPAASQTPAEVPPPVPADTRPTASDDNIRQALRAADETTRGCLQAVLASLQRFDHRLELLITPAHYTDLFGDNWAFVRQFVESPQGKSVPAVSVMLVELMILYKRAQEVRWVPINNERIRAWWSEAARRRKCLAEMLDAAARPETGDEATGPQASVPRPEAATPSAPKLNSPPSLDDLLRYYEWMNRG